MPSLNELRKQIDNLDSELVDLLARRLALTQQVGTIKQGTGAPIYMPEREAELLEKRKQEAEQKGVPPELAEDVLRRIIRESYRTQHVHYPQTYTGSGDVVVVGGRGALGSQFVSMFERSGYSVKVLEHADWADADTLLANAALVLIAVPLNRTIEVIQRLPKLPDKCVLADISSAKAQPMAAMLGVHGGPVVGLHPMFGPDTPNFVKQVVVVCHGRAREHYLWLFQQLQKWGAVLTEETAQAHDHAMTFIQVMRHFSSFVYGSHLAAENPPLATLNRLSSPIYRLELAMVGRLFAQSPELYADIIYDNPESIAVLQRFQEQLGIACAQLQKGDKQGFIDEFNRVKDWFGDFTQSSLQESRKILEKAQDDRSFISTEFQ
ncbi:bifunctional chorismate mutase/prephenate dehydrogenase [Aliidiomarina celeris]|uniref:bifunctional chorismate mutase/prephenate dehydrogenase n=1 Tax=Aliidiomarina celeris TaxID=2249428 RepID=UPI000DEA4B17|nr:bifunctional chorismate mutase/prephenate dehydrogenase [Aliidiomarina celeris]